MSIQEDFSLNLTQAHIFKLTIKKTNCLSVNQMRKKIHLILHIRKATISASRYLFSHMSLWGEEIVQNLHM